MTLFHEISTFISNIMSLDKDTLHSLGYAAWVYIMMDRFNAKPRRRYH